MLGKGCDEAAGRGEIARARHFAVGAGCSQRDRVPDFLEQMRRGARQQPRAHGLGGAAQQLLALLGHFGFKDYLKATPDVVDSDVTVEYCARNNWIVGSPATVTEKIEKIYHEVGGFGTLLVFGFDYKHKPEAWYNSLRLLKHEVMPRLKHLDAGLTKAA